MKKEFADIRNLYQNLYESNDVQERVSLRDKWAAKKQSEQNTRDQAAQIEKENPGALKKSFSGAIVKDKNNSNNNSSSQSQELSANPNMTSRKYSKSEIQGLNDKLQNQLNSPSNKMDKEVDDLIANTPIKGKSSNNNNVSSNNNNNNNNNVKQDQQKPVDTSKIKNDIKNNNNDQNSGGSGSNNSGGSGSNTTQKPNERQAWLDRTKNSPAAKAGLSDDQRWSARQGNQKFKQDNNRGEFSKPQPQQQQQAQPQQQQTKTVGGQGNRQRPVKTGGIQAGKLIRGGLRGLGNLASRGIQGAKNVAGNVANTVEKGVNAAGNTIQKGVQGVKRVVGGTADAVTGNLTDFDGRGGKPQGISRVVAGGIDKLTGDRTDLDRRGVTPLNAGQRAQQQQQQKPVVQQQQQKPVVQQQKPVAQQQKPVAQQQTQVSPQRQRRNDRLAAIKMRGNPRLQAQARMRSGTNVNKLFNSYDPTEDLFDSVSEFLISEGYAQDINEAISIMSEPEFIEGFDEGMEQILNESSENNK